MKNIVYILLVAFSCQTFALVPLQEKKVSAVNQLLAPFLQSIERLTANNRQFSQTKAEFNANVQAIWNFLSNKQRDWGPLLDLDKNIDQLVSARAQLRKKSYVLKVFTTKPGTLVFILKDYPKILVKMDNRSGNFIGPKDRGYFEALEKSQEVQQELMFDSLYLPLEAGAHSDYQTTNVVFSEQIPLFSLLEIDNRIFLNMLIRTAEDSPAVKERVKKMYKQMLHYICKVSFDDINYTNVPFAQDGRLAPFDTDSQSASTGIGNFLRLFFGYKVLTHDEVMNIVNQSCGAPNKPTEESITAIYNDHATEDMFFENNKKFIEEALNFLAEKQITFRDRFSMATIILDDPHKKYVKMIDEVFAQKIIDSLPNAPYFGQHCIHISDITYAAADKIVDKYPRITLPDAQNIVRAILVRVKEFGNLYSADDIDYRLGNNRDLKSFICF